MRPAIYIIAILSIAALGSALTDSRAQSKPDPQTTTHELGTFNQAEVLERLYKSPANYTFRAETDSEGLCKVHHEKLERATVPIVYGMTPAPPYSKATERSLFPNAIVRIDGGCISLGPKEAIVLQCEKCLRAREDWIKHVDERDRRH